MKRHEFTKEELLQIEKSAAEIFQAMKNAGQDLESTHKMLLKANAKLDAHLQTGETIVRNK